MDRRARQPRSAKSPRKARRTASPAHRTSLLMPNLQQVLESLINVQKGLGNVQDGLANVQNGLRDLMTSYLKHTGSVLSNEEGAIESLQLSENLAESVNAAMAATTLSVNTVAQSVAAAKGGDAAPAPDAAGKNNKRKREKKVKDPNAPKRPLTAAFLYAQAARPVVKKDLESELQEGAKLEPNAVQLEITKRWNESSEEEKEVSPHP
jgi:hypothetical protein